MKNLSDKSNKKVWFNFDNKLKAVENQKGSAIVIALLVMVLLLGFVALAITRTSNETIASSNDAAESRAFEAAQASLEIMTRNFDKIFDIKLNPDAADLTRIQGQIPPGFTDNTFVQTITPSGTPQIVVQTGGEFQGLNALRDGWKIDTIATDPNGVQVQLQRRFFNNRIPIFQFGIFYEDDLEFHPGPRFDFGGRVHSNGSLYLMAQTGLYFSSKVTAVKDVFTNVARNGSPWSNWGENVFIKNASGSYIQLRNNMGSVLTSPVNGTRKYSDPDIPVVYTNASYGSNENLFQGNLKANTNLPLNLPIKLENQINQTTFDYVELIRRGKLVGDLYNNGTGTPLLPNIVPVTSTTSDSITTTAEKYANKAGIRVTLADSKAKLPGCASGVGVTAVLAQCGVRLDGDSLGLGADPTLGAARGYQPLAMSDGYQATELNGERFYQPSPAGRQVWIKVETVGINPNTNVFEAKDITADILSLGITEPAPTITVSGNTEFQITGYGNKDSRSIIKLQRYLMPGVGVTTSDDANMTSYSWNGTTYNLVLTDDCTNSTYTTGCSAAVDGGSSFLSFSGDNTAHKEPATVDVTNRYRRVVPFPINMFDTREGLFNEDTAVFDRNNIYTSNTVPWSGVMSMVDIDIANLKRFLDGEYNSTLPTTTPFAVANGRLQNSDIFDANGWVFYVSDRRGDYDFDGEYDMEDIYGNNDGILQKGEDINNNTRLDTETTNEAPRYSSNGVATSSSWNSYVSPSAAAVIDHKFYRRGVRLINGTRLPGTYDSVYPNLTKGFSFASENGVYVLGNYNATGINSVGTPTASTEYLPQNTAAHIPASIAADAVTILSNGWSDSRSFRYPFDRSNRDASETTIRFAMLAGDARSSFNGTPNQGGGDPRLGGGVHNFKRFLEDWTNQRLNYTGSLINLYNSHNNNGAFKCCGTVYNPPTRNWVFDSTFLDPNRLPPGTPFFQAIRLSGFQRMNN